jgi:Calcineurin-like phosphoesterase
MSARRVVAMGDPQAPFTRVMEVLKARALLSGDKLADDVHLVVMGDYYDYGGREARAEAAEGSARLIAWLVSHAEEQVTLLTGNHDLARVGELAHMDDATFGRAQQEADKGYHDAAPVRPEQAFKDEFDLPSWEIVARDFSAFKERQRALVTDLLSARRMRAAFAPSARVLMIHAGVTQAQLATAGVGTATDARVLANALNRALYAGFDAWRAGKTKKLEVPGLHAPGSAAGEGTGLFYHRPALDPSKAPGRRFHPRELPVGITQVVGHIGDAKCRELLGADPAAAKDGPLRHLVARGDSVQYAHGIPALPAAQTPDVATMIFTDGGMLRAEPADYELFSPRLA